MHGVRFEIPISPVIDHGARERGDGMAGGRDWERDQETPAVAEWEGNEGDRRRTKANEGYLVLISFATRYYYKRHLLLAIY